MKSPAPGERKGMTHMSDNETTLLPMASSGSSCSCCATSEASAASADPAGATVAEYGVTGMTCGHCVASVTEEVGAIDGVAGVEVVLDAGGTSRVTVRSDAPIDPALVRAAVEEAGYEVVDA